MAGPTIEGNHSVCVPHPLYIIPWWVLALGGKEILAQSAPLRNSAQAQKHTASSDVQLPFRDVRVLNIQGRTHITTCHTMGCCNHKSTCIVYAMFVCMHVCMYCMYVHGLHISNSTYICAV